MKETHLGAHLFVYLAALRASLDGKVDAKFAGIYNSVFLKKTEAPNVKDCTYWHGCGWGVKYLPVLDSGGESWKKLKYKILAEIYNCSHVNTRKCTNI